MAILKMRVGRTSGAPITQPLLPVQGPCQLGYSLDGWSVVVRWPTKLPRLGMV
jgi:hypothetical protein